jgi:COMPASS component SPP1
LPFLLQPGAAPAASSSSSQTPSLAAPATAPPKKFKYKYPEAAPTPPSEEDEIWNKLYTAADSRMYNKHGKSANESRKYRQSGETYQLALQMLREKKDKAAALAAGGIFSPFLHRQIPESAFRLITSRSESSHHLISHLRVCYSFLTGQTNFLRSVPPPKKASTPKATAKKTPAATPIKKESSTSSRDATPSTDKMSSMSISEKVKGEGRARKASSAAAPSDNDAPGPSTATASTMMGSPAPPTAPKFEKEKPKKKGTATAVIKKKPGPKPKTEGMIESSLISVSI